MWTDNLRALTAGHENTAPLFELFPLYCYWFVETIFFIE